MQPKHRTTFPDPSRLFPAHTLALFLWFLPCGAQTRDSTAPQTSTPATQGDPDTQVVTDGPPPATAAERRDRAWTMLSQAASDKRSETRIQALAALGSLPEQRAYAAIETALGDTDVDTRTAAILAAGQSKDTRLIGKLHGMLDDKEPQVAFAAATTLWKMKDRSGEDILVAVAAGERRANATFVNGSLHTANKDFHNPSALARMGAEQGASLLLGPFGFGLSAYEAMRKNGGSSARVSAIEQLSEEHTGPIRNELLSALSDKDPGVRAAAAKALGAYPSDPAVVDGLYNLFLDSRLPVRYTAAAAYLRTVDGTKALPDPQKLKTSQASKKR